MKTQLLVAALLLSWHSQLTSAVLPFEPIQYISAHLPSGSSALGDFLQEASAQDAGSWLSTVKTNLKQPLSETDASIVLMKGDHVLLQHRVEGLQMNTSFEIPPANVLSVISIALPILFEGYDPEVVRDPINKVLKESSDTRSFLDLIAKLPGSEKMEPMSGLTNNGQLSLQFLNSLLDANTREVWMDAYMAMGVTSPAPSGKHPMSMSIDDLSQLSFTISHDVTALEPADNIEEFPLDNNNYLFGWWFNCPKATPTQCLIPHAPTDTIFSLSQDLRLYISPSLELTLIIVGPSSRDSKTSGNLADILAADEDIWKELDPNTVPDTSKRPL